MKQGNVIWRAQSFFNEFHQRMYYNDYGHTFLFLSHDILVCKLLTYFSHYPGYVE